MDEATMSKREEFHWGKWVVWALVVLVGYVLSAAPVQMLVWNEQWIRLINPSHTFYAPVWCVIDRSPAISDAYGQYREWWRKILPAAPGDF